MAYHPRGWHFKYCTLAYMENSQKLQINRNFRNWKLKLKMLDTTHTSSIGYDFYGLDDQEVRV
jgi:hypothetical protein